MIMFSEEVQYYYRTLRGGHRCFGMNPNLLADGSRKPLTVKDFLNYTETVPGLEPLDDAVPVAPLAFIEGFE